MRVKCGRHLSEAAPRRTSTRRLPAYASRRRWGLHRAGPLLRAERSTLELPRCGIGVSVGHGGNPSIVKNRGQSRFFRSVLLLVAKSLQSSSTRMGMDWPRGITPP